MKVNRLKVFGVLALLLIGLVAVSGIAKADTTPVSIEKIYVNDREINYAGGERRGGIEREDSLDLEVKFLSNGTDDEVVVHVEVDGLDHDSEMAEDETSPFSIEPGKTYYKKLSIKLPARMDIDSYALRVWISNRDDDAVTANVQLDVDSARNKIYIKDITFDPDGSVKAGYALLTTVRVKNVGEDTEDDVKVELSIPELGISQSGYIDNLDSEDTKKVEPLYVRIPECAKPGQYQATIKVSYDEGDESVIQNKLLNVVSSDACTTAGTGKTVVAVSSETQQVTAGQSGVVYPLTLSNTGSQSRTYVISTTAGSWADVKVSPNVVILGPSETKIVYVYVSAKADAPAGVQTFGVAIKSGEETLKEITLSANVVKAESAGWDKVKKGLEVALIILVVLLVIIGLIIGFNRLKGKEDEENEENTQTYY